MSGGGYGGNGTVSGGGNATASGGRNATVTSTTASSTASTAVSTPATTVKVTPTPTAQGLGPEYTNAGVGRDQVGWAPVGFVAVLGVLGAGIIF